MSASTPSPSRVIYKFKLVLGMPTHVPRVVRTLHVGVQDGEIMVWCEVVPQDEAGAERGRTYGIYGTGNRVSNPGAMHVGTVHMPPYVWHVYEVVK